MEEFIVNAEELLKNKYDDEHWKIMSLICFKFTRKSYDDDLFQVMFIAFEKLSDDIKFRVDKKYIKHCNETILYPSMLGNKLEVMNRRRWNYIYKTLLRACSKYLVSKSNIVKKQTPLTTRETEEFIRLRKKKNKTKEELSRYEFLMELKDSIHKIEINDEGDKELKEGETIENSAYMVFNKDKTYLNIIKLATESLTSDEKLLIDKHYIYGFTDDEISKDFGITRSAVQVRRKKILAKMRETLLDLGIDEDVLL